VEIFSADYLLAFLTPEYHAVLAWLQGSRQVVPLRDTRVQIAITHWLFASWPDHLSALFDALQLRCLHLSFGPSFEEFLPRLFIGREYDEAYTFMDRAYERYRSTFDRQGYAALVDRVQQRLDAFGDIPYNSLRG
jgi:hypothetical protein